MKCTEQMWISNSASGNLLYTYRQLVDKDFDFFAESSNHIYYEKQVIRPLPVVTDHRRAAGNSCS